MLVGGLLHDQVTVDPREPQLSPANLMAVLTSSDVARGTRVGAEVLDGQPVDH